MGDASAAHDFPCSGVVGREVLLVAVKGDGKTLVLNFVDRGGGDPDEALACCRDEGEKGFQVASVEGQGHLVRTCLRIDFDVV